MRHAFRRTIPIHKRNMPALWCVQIANTPYEFSNLSFTGKALKHGGQAIKFETETHSIVRSVVFRFGPVDLSRL